MNELTRMAYLEAIGIENLVSRRDLPGAAPSRRIKIVRRPLEPVLTDVSARAPVQHQVENQVENQVESQVESPAGSQALPRESAAAAMKASLNGDGGRSMANAGQDTPAEAPRASKPAAQDIPIFSLAATYAGGWFWLDEIPAGRELSASYSQLLQAICSALGLSEPAAQVEQFSWPLTTRGHLDQGLESARGALLGYLTNRIERSRPRGVVLLGDMSQDWFDPACLPELPSVTTVSAWQMLRNPALKAQAWSDLQQLSSGDG